MGTGSEGFYRTLVDRTSHAQSLNTCIVKNDLYFSVKCQQKTVTRAYHTICTRCAQQLGVCEKCGQKEEIISK